MEVVTRFSAALICLVLAGCADMSQSQRSTAEGAGIGAAAGAVIGALAGGGKGAAIGAAAGAGTGALGGYLWNEHLEKQKQQMQKATEVFRGVLKPATSTSSGKGQ